MPSARNHYGCSPTSRAALFVDRILKGVSRLICHRATDEICESEDRGNAWNGRDLRTTLLLASQSLRERLDDLIAEHARIAVAFLC